MGRRRIILASIGLTLGLVQICSSCSSDSGAKGSLDSGGIDAGNDAALPDGSGQGDAAASSDASSQPDGSAEQDASTQSDGGSEDGGAAPPSCRAGGPGLTTCGDGGESCCISLLVPGGTFFRTYVNSGSGATGTADPATVSDVRLDKYLVTVGRFRQFVAAWNGGAGFLPAAGSGKHSHLNGGSGLAATTGGNEAGWAAVDDANVAVTDANLVCDPDHRPTWTASPAANEMLPMNCVNWYEAYAFCIWDGGFLPSESEWEHAAAGGSEQREYPWGSTAPGSENQYAVYGCHYPTGTGLGCQDVSNIAPVGSAPLGAGRWGQLDLAGELSEWNLDWLADYVNPCVDCADVTPALVRLLRGGSFEDAAELIVPARRFSTGGEERLYNIGIRCARAP